MPNHTYINIWWTENSKWNDIIVIIYISIFFKNIWIINITVLKTISKNLALLAKVKGEVSNDEDDEYNADNKVVEEDANYDADDEAEEEDSEDGILV